MHWCFGEMRISPKDLTRRIMMRYLDYCQAPPAALIAYRNVAQFVLDKEWGERLPNPQWRPFLGKRELGRELPYRLSEQAMKTKLAILSAFFQFLIQEEYMDRNPALLLQRVKRSMQQESDDHGQAFSELQWSYVMQAADLLAVESPEQHERSRFLISLMYACYLRISEVAARPGFTPSWGSFAAMEKPASGAISFPAARVASAAPWRSPMPCLRPSNAIGRFSVSHHYRRPMSRLRCLCATKLRHMAGNKASSTPTSGSASCVTW